MSVSIPCLHQSNGVGFRNIAQDSNSSFPIRAAWRKCNFTRIERAFTSNPCSGLKLHVHCVIDSISTQHQFPVPVFKFHESVSSPTTSSQYACSLHLTLCLHYASWEFAWTTERIAGMPKFPPFFTISLAIVFHRWVAQKLLICSCCSVHMPFTDKALKLSLKQTSCESQPTGMVWKTAEEYEEGKPKPCI